MAGNSPQITKAQNPNTDTKTIKSGLQSAKEAKIKPFTAKQREIYIKRRGIDPNAITEIPDILSEVQRKELLLVAARLDGGVMIEDICTPNNASWFFAVLDRVAAEILHSDGIDPENSYPFLLAARIAPIKLFLEISPPMILYRELRSAMCAIKAKPDIWDCMLYASFFMIGLSGNMKEAETIKKYKKHASKTGLEIISIL